MRQQNKKKLCVELCREDQKGGKTNKIRRKTINIWLIFM